MRRFFLFAWLLFISAASAADVYNDIYQRLSAEQVRQEQQFRVTRDANGELTVASWQQQAGLFASWIKLNFVGGPLQDWARTHFKIFDNNYFVTAWVLDSVINAHDAGVITMDKQQLDSAISAEMTYLDKNNPDTTLISFWPQQQVDGHWQASPENLTKVLDSAEALTNDFVKACSVVFGHDKCQAFVDKAPFVARLETMRDAFHIPADADDTSVNFSLGVLLYQHQADPVFADAYQLWRQANSDTRIKAALAKMVHYAYRPAGDDVYAKLIDPRTYFLAHDYLQTVEQPSLVATWALSLKDEQDELAEGGDMPVVSMPFNLNNLDASVMANYVYGIASLQVTPLYQAAVAGDAALDASLAKLTADSADYLVWVMNTDAAMQRPDIAILYYPPKYNVYWFASRTVALVRAQGAATSMMQQVADKLEQALQQHGTDALLAAKTVDGDAVYWDDFLGDADHHVLSKEVMADDRLYSTAVVVNTLLNTWSQVQDGRRTWLVNTPDTVKDSVSKAVVWLRANALGKRYRKENAFFSGSVKGLQSLPFLYPANLFRYIDGTPYDPTGQDLPDDPRIVVGMSGLVPDEQYQQWVAAEHFGYPTPTEFHGFNDKKGPFPYWSAPAFTYAVVLEAVADYAQFG